MPRNTIDDPGLNRLNRPSGLNCLNRAWSDDPGLRRKNRTYERQDREEKKSDGGTPSQVSPGPVPAREGKDGVLPYPGAKVFRTKRPGAYRRLREMLGERPDAPPGPAPLWVLAGVLRRMRPERCSAATLRRMAVLAMLVAKGRLEWVLGLRAGEILRKVKLPGFGWKWVAVWLHERLVLQHGQDEGCWLEARPWFGRGQDRIGAGVALQLATVGWPPWRAGQVARAGVPSRPWKRYEKRRDNGPRCWPGEYAPVTFEEWADTRLGRKGQEWLQDLVRLARS